eukprot:COSAG02_NODE_5461_length_4300_cov_29.607712_3_plen_107_part_00
MFPFAQEREECWEGAIPFLEYAYRAITYGLRWSIPCLGNAYDFAPDSLDSERGKKEDEKQNETTATGSGAKLSRHGSVDAVKQAAKKVVRMFNHPSALSCCLDCWC